jgi:DNA-directed RNA polymerase specialized sigma24 family protein
MDYFRKPSFVKGQKIIIIMENLKLIKELSSRQKEVLSFKDRGLSAKKIAEMLEVSVNTINYHIKKARAKDRLSKLYKPVSISICFKWVRNKWFEPCHKFVCRNKIEKAVKNSNLNELYKNILLDHYGENWLNIRQLQRKYKKSNTAIRILLSRARKQLTETNTENTCHN